MEQEQRELMLEQVIGLLKNNPFTFEIKVKKKPAGMKVIYECTKEYLDALMDEVQNRRGDLHQ